MLESWPISRRISSGYVLLTLMLVGLAAFSYRSVGALGDGYFEYRTIAGQNIAVTAFVEDIFEARLAAVKYGAAQDDAKRQDVIANIDEVLGDTQAILSTFESDPQRQTEIQRMIGLAGDYKASFSEFSRLLAQAATDRQALDDQSAALVENVNAIFTNAVQQGAPAVVSASARLLQATLTAISQSAQFVQTNDAAEFARFQDELANADRILRQLTALNPAGPISDLIANFANQITEYPDQLTRYSTSLAGAEQVRTDILDQVGPEMQDGLDRIATDIVIRQDQLGVQGNAILDQLNRVIPLVGALATLTAMIAAFVIGRWITKSVARLADTTDRLASGDNEAEITGTDHDHELGRMSRALRVFREAQIARLHSSAERAKMREQQDAVMAVMQHELAQLADGNLTIKISQPFAPEYEQLRDNFNAAVAALHDAISKVMDTSQMIGDTTAQTNAATNDLSQRTENQAATLEQTAAALDELTASVRSAAEHAKSVDVSVNLARAEATQNGAIVAQAVSAMGAIEQSSKQITEVISVIDDIAFQTNLLALNAGVEAARAGESGRGFAVVASEVRALAQRSADAAKEISELIAKSSRHVQQGTQLVGHAGEALSAIITQVNDIAVMTSQIATSAHEQSIGLSEINIGVNQLDQVTQQNAAMVQESMSRGDTLSTETRKLMALIAQFKVMNSGHLTLAQDEGSDMLSAAISRTHWQNQASPDLHIKRTSAAGASQAMWQDF